MITRNNEHTVSGLSYDDVLLVPRYSDIISRSEINLDSDLGNDLCLTLPVFSSPMDTVTEDKMCIAMDTQGGSGIIHRYNTIDEQSEIISKAAKNINNNIGAAIGITGDYLERASEAYNQGANFLCVDVAHGHHATMKTALHRLRIMIGDDYHIMAGNVATLEGINDLADWGANSVRCNIGGGSICSTRIQTGHGVPGLQTIINCSLTDRDVKIIADGGIRNSGDIVKALAAGADAVMCGSLLAGTLESPGQIHKGKDGFSWKTYRGMASKEAQVDWKGKYSSFEGVSSTVPYKGPVSDILYDLEKGIRSGLSYSGARTISELQAKAIFVTQTSAGATESGTHITHRQW
tara:strand:- start:7858 stop:8904 length:1047 start_codon:yes stop_codon:yes gene_type:complete